MFYITEKDSETGKKLAAVDAKIQEAAQAQRAMGEKYGFSQFADAWYAIAGGISFVIFDEEPDMKIWKHYKKHSKTNRYYPRTVPAARQIHNDFYELPTVTNKDLNAAVGYKTGGFGHIGYVVNSRYYGFEVPQSAYAEFTAPPDCEEITGTSYHLIFQKA